MAINIAPSLPAFCSSAQPTSASSHSFGAPFSSGLRNVRSRDSLPSTSLPAKVVRQEEPKQIREETVDSKFDELVENLKAALGPSSGLTSDDVDVEHLTRLMKQYDGAGDLGWKRYEFGDASRGYTRNLVDEGNGKSNLLILVWSPGKGSPIHDHGNAHCLMKILKGNLTETRYDFPDPRAEGPRPMELISEKVYGENQVAYMADELGVHRVQNRGTDFAVSLHLYTPPNVAKGGCYIFDEKTSRRSHVAKCGNYSAFGKLLKDEQ